MNLFLQHLNFNQLLELFLGTTREFITGLEKNHSFKELNALREQIKNISEAIRHKQKTIQEPGL